MLTFEIPPLCVLSFYVCPSIPLSANISLSWYIINVLLTICPCSVSGPWISNCAGDWKGVAQWEYISLFSSIRAWIALLLAWIHTMKETPRRRIMITSSCSFIFISINRCAIFSRGYADPPNTWLIISGHLCHWCRRKQPILIFSGLCEPRPALSWPTQFFCKRAKRPHYNCQKVEALSTYPEKWPTN